MLRAQNKYIDIVYSATNNIFCSNNTMTCTVRKEGGVITNSQLARWQPLKAPPGMF